MISATPLERAAQALIEKESKWGSESFGTREYRAMARARAALAAIEEPSEAMIEAGNKEIEITLDSASIWRAMHKALMEEK